MRIKVHLVITTAGDIWEFYATPASVADITALKSMDLDLPYGATLFGVLNLIYLLMLATLSLGGSRGARKLAKNRF